LQPFSTNKSELITIYAQINISGEKSRRLDTLAKLFHCILTRHRTA